MLTGLSAALTSLNRGETVQAPLSFVDYLGSRDGVAIDFRAGQMRINDAATPSNAYFGSPEGKLKKYGADPYLYDPAKGMAIDAARDFSVALATTAFPFNPAACTVYVKYYLNAETSAEQRYLFMVDNAGTDRLALYSVPGGPFRYVTGDGAVADIAVSAMSPVASGEQRVIVGTDLNGKTYVDEAGIQNDTADTLASGTPGFFGIGGYPDRVLRVLDGHIAEIMIVTESMEKEERLSLDLPTPQGGGTPAPPPEPEEPEAFQILGGRNGFAIDFVTREMRINDKNTPANAFTGDPENKLTVFGSDPYDYDPVHGLNVSASRDFSVALDTAIFPFNPEACTVYARFRLNAAASDEQRYLFMTDNAGVDRFAMYSVPGQTFRFVTGDGFAADIELTNQSLAADTDYRVVFGADQTGKSLIDDTGVAGDSAEVLQSFTPAHVGIAGYNDRVLRVLDGHLAEITVITDPLPKSLRLSLPPFGKIYRAEGDSHTYNASWGVSAEDFYPSLVSAALGPRTLLSNYGGSGDSTAEMVYQLPTLLSEYVPDIATIYGGANDGPIDIVGDTTPTTTTFSVDAPYAPRLEPGGHVSVNGAPATITARNGNEITVSPALSSAPAVGDTVDIDTQKNIETWIAALQDFGCRDILVIGFHFINFANGGDTPSAEHPTRAALRAKQKAAADTMGVPYCDTYAHMAGVVAGGGVTLGDDLAWHVGVGNTHLNTAGEAALADAVIARMTGLGWING